VHTASAVDTGPEQIFLLTGTRHCR